ncbi:complement component C7 [Vanacampus margaritifer]
MTKTARLCVVVLPWLLSFSTLKGSCEEAVHCSWGAFGEWSECDGCSQSQARSRIVQVYAQFGGDPCLGVRTETKSCVTTQGCPLADGCGNRFRCRSGKCVSRSLLCNGDRDCDDGDDEHDCDHTRRYIICPNDPFPARYIEVMGHGFDVVSGKSRGIVIDTKSFGGQCRPVYSGIPKAPHRLPLSTTKLRFMINDQTEFSEEMFTSEWHYAKEMSAQGLLYRGLDLTGDTTQNHTIFVSKMVTEVGEFQAASPQYIPLIESFWKDLAQLPLIYNYNSYRKFLETYGTHYFSKGNLGDVRTVFTAVSTETQRQKAMRKDVPPHWIQLAESDPKVIKPKLRRLSELVKEVPCGELKRFNLDRALEEYLSESEPCHCLPCRNNGLAVMEEGVCKCICKPGTSGLACENRSGVVHEEPDVTDGSWSCWSAWSTCHGGHKSRIRSCSNPPPQGGGQACKGDGSETVSDCDYTEHFKKSEPQCLEPTALVKPTCGTPPALINGYILEPKEVYLVGNKVEYKCTSVYRLHGQNILECTANQTWSAEPGLCDLPRCKLWSLAHEIVVTPLKSSYGIGEMVTLSCPEGRQFVGQSKIVCNDKLQFSPDPEDFACRQIIMQKQQQDRFTRSTRCEPWEKLSGEQCVCKMPFECRSSLEVCATDVVSGKSVVVSVCKLHALRCIHINYKLAADSACKWPQRNTTSGCRDCQMWEMCDENIGECRCKDHAECVTPGFEVCVRTGEDVPARGSMSECEAGLRRCKGEKVSVVDIMPCDS